MMTLRRFPLLETVNKTDSILSIEKLPVYLEMAYSIFKESFNEKTDEECRWSFLMWAYEDETNEIYRHVRRDSYVQNLFSMPHEIVVSHEKKVRMHEYHYQYFKKNMESFERWGFNKLEKTPEKYLLWFYEYCESSNIAYGLASDKFTTSLCGDVLPKNPSIMVLPRYLEAAYLNLGKHFQHKLEDEARWSFLMWAYDDESNVLCASIRKDKYISELFSTPHKIRVDSNKIITMHEYHYRYFKQYIKSFQNWGFDSIEKNPHRYLEWFYHPDNSKKIPYSIATVGYLNDK